MKKKIIFLFIILLLCTSGCDKKDTADQKKIVNILPDYNYSIMKKQITKLEENYDEIKLAKIGKSIQDRNLYLLSLGQGEKIIVVVGGFHGREGLTSLLLMKIIEEYTESLNKNKSLINYDIEKILNRVTFLFIPMVNPDGIEIAVNGIDSLKNKDFYIKANEGSNNFERWKANSRGVDLNKQFNADWKRTKSTEKPHFSDYKGPFFESEPESKALADLTRNNHISAVVCFHHSGRVIYWYYKQGKSTFKRDQELVKQISKINGYDPVKPEESDTKAAGYKDWFIKKFNKPGFTIEIGNKDKSKKPLPENKLPVFYKENREVLLELAENL